MEDGPSSNVFVNCPLDTEYDPLLKVLLFTTLCLGYNPRLASERTDSGEQRLSKICELIETSRFSIHDLSRLRAREEGEFHRMNMPFELGVDYGCRTYGGSRVGGKRFLILETKRYDYMKALSDLSGVDIESHDDEGRVLVRKVRNWFRSNTGDEDVRGPAAIWYDYADFRADLYDKLKKAGFSDDDIEELPIAEYMDYVRRWVSSRRT